ncbi:MAG: class I SAM-dependent methyltransferase [Pyrinomonadaceae bacterium]
MSRMTWEHAVRWYRDQPDHEAEIRNNYFDLPVLRAAERYACGEEFAEVLRLLGPGNERRILEPGAGNGIASFALANNGWLVTALEPDDSQEVGAGAIREIVAQTGLPITAIEEFGEKLAFADASFDAIYARQVLHHASDLELMVQELARVLRRGGLWLSTREHVADDEQQLLTFRDEHPLHKLYGGENAYPLDRYLQSFRSAGLRIKETWGPLESILNFFPGTERDRQISLRQVANHSYLRLGRVLGWSNRFKKTQVRRHTLRDRTPGRLYSFLLEKP